MGGGLHGGFGNTKGKRNHIAMAKTNQILSISLVVNASKSIQNLASNSPIKIPKGATYIKQTKDGYTQVKFNFNRANIEYESRWHTQTPNAPNGTGATYQVTKKIKGSGYGKSVSKSELYHLIKYPNGNTKWISHSIYQNALRNIKNGNATNKEKEIIKYGHIK